MLINFKVLTRETGILPMTHEILSVFFLVFLNMWRARFSGLFCLINDVPGL